jgi:hypothetical protein
MNVTRLVARLDVRVVAAFVAAIPALAQTVVYPAPVSSSLQTVSTTVNQTITKTGCPNSGAFPNGNGSSSTSSNATELIYPPFWFNYFYAFPDNYDTLPNLTIPPSMANYLTLVNGALSRNSTERPFYAAFLIC